MQFSKSFVFSLYIFIIREILNDFYFKYYFARKYKGFSDFEFKHFLPIYIFIIREILLKLFLVKNTYKRLIYKGFKAIYFLFILLISVGLCLHKTTAT